MKLFKPYTLSHDNSQVLKGLGILLIILHNFCHNIPGALQENEFLFLAHRSTDYFASLLHLEHPLINLFSYWGHFGVALFVFLTAYGFTRKSLTQPASLGQSFLGGTRFVAGRAWRLWSLMLVAFALYLLGNVVYGLFHTPGEMVYLSVTKKELWVFTLINNLIRPWTEAYYYFGPWWYWGLALQLVVLYRLAVHERGLGWALGLCVLSLGVGVYLGATHSDWQGWAYYKENFLGWMLPFTAGVLLARRGLTVTWPTALLAALLLVVSCFNVYLWLLSPLFALLFLLGVGQALRGDWLVRPLAFVGRYSMYIFATHTIVRWWVQGSTTTGNFWYKLPVYLILTALFAWLAAVIHRRIPSGKP